MWNWEAYLEVAILCTRDLNGDGYIDQFGSSLFNLSTNLLNSNAVNIVGVSGGKLETTLFEDPGIRTLNFFRDLVYIYKVVDTSANATQQVQNFIKGTTAMYFTGPAGPDAQLYPQKVDYKVAFIPKGPDVAHISGWNVVLSNGGMMLFLDNSEFTLKERVAVFAYTGIDYGRCYPEDPDTYIDWEDRQRVELITRRLYTEEEVEHTLYVRNHLNYQYCVYDYVSGIPGLTALLNTNVFNPIGKGESVGYVLDASKMIVEQAIKW
jgi:hypothetical protein